MEHSEIVCVILCGGQGKRMRSTDRHKVCFPIAGTPAIVRAVGTLKSVGLRRFLIVVGQMSQQVIATLANEHPDAAFIYQPSPRGTGHAASCAAAYLQASGYDGNVIISMGDKVIQPNVVAELIDRHTRTDADMTVTALPKTPKTTAGRIVIDSSDKPVGVVELADIRRSSRSRRPVSLAGRRFSAGQIERRSPNVNASLYMFKAEILYKAIASLNDDNAQGELYLTDTVEYVASGGGKTILMQVKNAEDLMAYNTPEELLAVEEVLVRRLTGRRRITAVRPKLSRRCFRPAEKWMEILMQNPPSLRRAMTAIYGPDENLLAERRKAFDGVLKTFIRAYGPERKVVLARAPGRINLLGRHIDHRGGYVNVMAINREVVLAASPREDDTVTLVNQQAREFPRRQFRIGDLLRRADWSDWMDFINSATVRQVLDASRGDWSNYARAAILRLQHACPDHRLIGADFVIAGNIPMGAGLSSSSAMVVGVAEVSVAINGLDMTTQQFVDLCGEGEWFVGSRGGSADHAAIRSGERGRVSKVGFFPFRVEQTIAWPDEMSLVIANSHIRAAKSAGARDTYNHRVACYNLAEMIMRQRVAILRNMEHLRDVNPGALGVSPVEVYKAMKRLPVQITRTGVARLLADEYDRLKVIFATHDDVGPYRLRDVAIFGISECLRSDMYADLLRKNQGEQIGTLMRISHDGDRVVRFTGTKTKAHVLNYSDARLDRLIAEVASGDTERCADAALWAQPGRYACSTKEIDLLVDIACSTKGVLGAQLAGAGLGGCAMILCQTDAVNRVFSALRRGYYRPRGLKFDVHLCHPVAGSGVLSI
ncbi:MAG: NTP transferase domain-containing protein [Planctomycetota bacterium]|nr:NTP transferase domain-containing protein [Planctomycetota bacterium]